jgi:hypothetical protein
VLLGPDNMIVLCPAHHRFIDEESELCTADWLRHARTAHEAKIAGVVVSVPESIPLQPAAALTFRRALEVWELNSSNSDEAFWHKLFREQPYLIAQAVPNHIIQFSEKCYLGGKGINNSGGNVVDFLYVVQSTSNLVVVEIKTPTTKLLGTPYRANSHSVSEELTGAIVQALNYRDQAVKNYHNLAAESEHNFNAFNPICLIVAGNVNAECNDSKKRRSLELFRSASQVLIVGYDELFAKVQNLVDILGNIAYASFTCPECGARQSPCLHTYRSNCGGRITDDLYCEDCDMRITQFYCDECGARPSARECID